MGDDIEEMERMLNEYFEFSRHQKNEETESVDIKNLVNDIIKKYTDKTIHFVQEENLLINLRAIAIKRCLTLTFLASSIIL